MQTNRAPKDIDEYIARYPPRVQARLRKIRATIRKAAPDAGEAIKYQIPAFTLDGNLVFFAAYPKHIGLYPAPRGVESFKNELSRYEGGKGTVRFPLDQPVPFSLITRIVKFLARKNRDNARAKTNRRA